MQQSYVVVQPSGRAAGIIEHGDADEIEIIDGALRLWAADGKLVAAYAPSMWAWARKIVEAPAHG